MMFDAVKWRLLELVSDCAACIEMKESADKSGIRCIITIAKDRIANGSVNAEKALRGLLTLFLWT